MRSEMLLFSGLSKYLFYFRWETINAVSKTGGHLGSSLGVVELTGVDGNIDI
jgi:deoxyxylulose-5-phosphate synthase